MVNQGLHTEYSLGQATISPLLIREQYSAGSFSTLCRFRRRYTTHEKRIAELFGLNGVRDLKPGSGLAKGMSWLREQFAG
jgi:hypothetical protein